MWIRRPKQCDRGDMEIGGKMGQPRVMSDETIGMCNDSSHRKKVKVLEHPK
jgi:hypothetical protein